MLLWKLDIARWWWPHFGGTEHCCWLIQVYFCFLKTVEKTIYFFVIFSLPLFTKSCFWFLINSQHTSQQMLFEKILSGRVLFFWKSYIVWSLAKSTRASWERAMNFKPRLMSAIPNLLMYYHLLVASIISSQYTCTNNQNKAFFLFFSCRLPGRTARLCLLFWSWPETNEMRPISVRNHKIKNKR